VRKIAVTYYDIHVTYKIEIGSEDHGFLASFKKILTHSLYDIKTDVAAKKHAADTSARLEHIFAILKSVLWDVSVR
jgi:hypothetical protein